MVLTGIVASSVGSALRAQTSGSASLVWLAVSVLGAVVSGMTVLVVNLVRGRRDLSARQSQRVAYDDALDPLVQSLAKLVDLDEHRRAAARGEFVRQVLVSACQLLRRDGSRVRASYYAAEAGEGDAVWRSVQSTGRSGAPTTTFTPGTAAGDAVVTMLREGEPRLCRDVRVDPPPGWESKEHDYRTFITVPARTKAPGAREAASYGFLTVDAPQPGDLTHDDVPLVRLLATLLAVATVVDLTLGEREADGTVHDEIDLRGDGADDRGDGDGRGPREPGGAEQAGTGPRHRLCRPVRADARRP